MSHRGRSALAVAVRTAGGPAVRIAAAAAWPAAVGLRRADAEAPRRVLIVEDETIIAMSLEALVEDFGFEACGVAATGVEAVEMAKALRPDLILMDVNLLGGMDGIEAARLARDAIGVSIVFVTAYGSGEILERIRSTHPNAPVVSKPVEPSALLRAIESTEAS